MSRWLTIPAPANTKGVSPSDKLEFKDFFIEMVFTRIPRKDEAQIRIARSLLAKLEECKEGDEIMLRDDEHEALSKAMPHDLPPSPMALPGKFLSRLMDFFDAVVCAEEEDKYNKRKANGAKAQESGKEAESSAKADGM